MKLQSPVVVETYPLGVEPLASDVTPITLLTLYI